MLIRFILQLVFAELMINDIKLKISRIHLKQMNNVINTFDNGSRQRDKPD